MAVTLARLQNGYALNDIRQQPGRTGCAKATAYCPKLRLPSYRTLESNLAEVLPKSVIVVRLEQCNE
jgi:hypothetical protein